MKDILNISNCSRLARVVMLAALLVHARTHAQPNGQWDFDSGNLNATVGSPLLYADGDPGPTKAGTQFGTTTSFGIPNINGTPANVMKFPIATNGMGYSMPDPASGNGGGTTVNEWTLIMDLLYPSASDSVTRPIIDTDGSFFVAGPDFIINNADGLGAPPGGPFVGTISPNTWNRIGITVTASSVNLYINGQQVGTMAGAGLDNRFALTAGANSLILGSTANAAAVGYVNSIQLRTNALNAGQMLALGGPSATGIPQVIPPVPSFIQSSTPAPNASGIGPQPPIHVVLNQGDTTVTSSSIKLYYDGALQAATVTPTSPTFDVTNFIAAIQDPNSIHSLALTWSDSVAGANSNYWTFTIINYQNLFLPAPFYTENFDELTETNGPTPLPAGWTVSNQTAEETAGFNLDNLSSDSYKDWVLISSAREVSWGSPPINEPGDRLNLPPIVLNGKLLTLGDFLSNGVMWAESDQRCGGCNGQYQELYTADIDCSGKSNVFVGFNSFYEQNQDNMNCVEYSIDQGAHWLPVRYLFCALGNGESSDIYYTNGVIDVGQTFYTVDPNRNWSPDTSPVHATNYAIYVKAPITTALIPYIKGYTNDDTFSSKEIMVVRLPQADNQSKVRFRFLNTGTSSWFWGIDDFALYSINTPVIAVQPASQTIDAATPVTFTVSAASASPLTYVWKKGNTVVGGNSPSFTIASVSPSDAGQYQVTVSNSDGPTKSSLATLTVVTTPQILAQPSAQVADPGETVAFVPATRGGRPLTYSWYHNAGLQGSTSSNLTLVNVQSGDAGQYQMVVANSYGSVTSAVAQLTIVTGTAITNNLVVHLPFDNNLNDTSGRGNNATYLHNGTAGDANPTFATGQIGQSYQYTTLIDATKFDYASLGYPADLQFGSSTPFSVSMWINYTNQDDDLPFISNKDWASSGNQGWGIFCQGGDNFRLNLTGPTGANKFSVSPAAVLKDGNWHHLLASFVRDPNSLSSYVYSYVDGVLVDRSVMLLTSSIDTFANDFTYGSHLPNVTNATPTVQTSFAVNIGQDGTGVYYDNGSAYNIGARIDDLGIWRRALSGNEAKGIYNAGVAGKDLTQAIPVAKLLVSVSGGNILITWQGSPTVKLQKSTTINPASWSDASAPGASSASIPITGAEMFFKLAQ